ncbi:HAD family phosphatase [Actinoplanes sp. NBRC 101535]|uniref:HAD family hydrolase n=1 Tax=Actinoplanes sp. NBRC 101535 TaxID=3032196 RepID=UPI00249FDA60|nr:HAD family phosphatase [Actinoplanes sp. NBRC 101535]GLY02998.1 haloacid dehalogenase [Actinoplanes sp. NBRC 101535]
MTIRAVVFDVGGVLARVTPMDFDRVWEARLGLAGGTIGTTMADVWTAGEVGRVTEDEVHRAMADRLGLTAPQVDAIMADMWTQYLGVAETTIIEYARSLRPAVRTGIISNSFVGAREREHARYGFGDLVDELIYSHEVGLRKPDPALWELACRRMGCAPREVVFVDDVPRLVDSARAFGMQAVLMDDPARVVSELAEKINKP